MNKKKMISTPNMKVWIMLHFLLIKKLLNLKQFIGYSWESINLKHGITVPTQYTIITLIASTYVSSA